MIVALSSLAAPSCARRAAPEPLHFQPHAATAEPNLGAPSFAVAAMDEATEEPANEAKPSTMARCAGEPMPIATTKPRAACDPSRSVERVTLLHFSDLHGHVQPYLPGKRSPLAVMRAFAERRRQETGGRVLFFDAGDDLEKGSLAEIRSQGEATVHLLDRLGLDARTLGNHDFAWGTDSVLRQAASEAHDVLATNISYEGPSTFGARRSVVYEIGCARIGVFGLVVNPYDETDERVDASYLGVFRQTHDAGDTEKYVSAASAEVRELREVEGVDAVVALDHLGIWRDRALVDAVPGLDLVISSHDHVAINGYVQGRHGAMVASGAFLGGAREGRIGETTLDVDVRAHAAKLVSATSHRVDDLRDLDTALEAEVERVVACFAPDADRSIADLDGALVNANVDTWTPVMDAAIRRRFPDAAGFLYEAWMYGGVAKGELARGPVTPQELADFAFSERQRAGGPGFTAFEPIEIDGMTLRDLCTAPLRDPPGQHMRRSCPSEIRDEQRYVFVVERRPLHAPSLAFLTVPKLWPKPPADESHAVEAMDLLIEHARARGRACKALDRDVPATCRG